MNDKKTTDSPRTVKFNVGGKSFETSVSLIDQHEDTMLARLVSDTWQEDPNKTVFIDRNGDIFAHILDYLRYGSITLPDNIVKDMFLRDLDFYGIVPEEGTVKSASEAWASQIDERHNKIKGHSSKIKEHEDQRKRLKLENDIEFLANYCAGKYASHGISNIDIKPPSNKESNTDKEILWNALVRVHGNKSNKEALSKALMKFGLSLSGEGVKPHSVYTN